MPRPKANSMKVQATISGYTAWAFARMMEAKGQSKGDVARYVIDRWFDDNEEYLAERGISREAFQRSLHGAAVVPLTPRKKSNQE